jgi:RHH-type proline utilization regulon transcriptional repressor/proline dehydrogenase/delta 1-pyrroline-5-carboxylate dehydrogenase
MLSSPSRSLSKHLYRPELDSLRDLLAALDWDEVRARRVQARAAHLIEKVRATRRKTGSIESFFQQYSLSTPEGVALMCLAEALLRIPDGPTATALIKDKVAGTRWIRNTVKGGDWLTKATGLGLSISGATLNSLFSKLGEPVIRQAIGQAMKLLGSQFVIGQDIDDAQKMARKMEKDGYRFSYDMLGEGARTDEDAQHYFNAYKQAIEDIDAAAGSYPASISVKLSALHPRFKYAQEDRCIPDLSTKLTELCRMAAAKKIDLTVDAEEVDRLETSLKIIENVMRDDALKQWSGFGLAVQAYQKRAMPLIDHLLAMARTYDRRIRIRLVKGAYWDSEIKRAQSEGLPDYPVFTRKANTDVSYLACAQKLLANRDRVYPMFGTHNAHTVAAIIDMAGANRGGFEFQKLFGMGDALYDALLEEDVLAVCVYAPVGSYQHLLPYLVRRLLENGANSSFVNKIYDRAIPSDRLAGDPVTKAQSNESKRHPKIPLPDYLYGASRTNSRGIDLTDFDVVVPLLQGMQKSFKAEKNIAQPLIGGKAHKSAVPVQVFNPARQNEVVGTVHFTDTRLIDHAFETAQLGYKKWAATPAASRASALDNIAYLMEENRTALMMLCVKEGGKTIPDALAEVREAVDFCRYYAAQGRRIFAETGTVLPGPTGESNIYTLGARGVFVCISPWNFPLAIFMGQITAALMAGNAVIAKPAEQTSLIASFVVKLMHKAGIPESTLTLLPGDGRVGEALVQHRDTAGVAFTGSTAVARSINQSLAVKEGTIVPLIAETGGQNAFIADSSALTEQVIDDVITSAFGSAGQRCSAARVFFIQEDVAEKTLHMLKGAMAQLRVGDPSALSTDVGPVIDEEALSLLQRHRSRLDGAGKLIAQAPLSEEQKHAGHFFAPVAYEIPALDFLKTEVFGPILHVIRFRGKEIDSVIKAVNDTGYGLTFGLHTRIQALADRVTGAVQVGNAYVNRSTIGAVVGVQPFGGHGLSGTGPKAGGPYYLQRFATEKVVSTNTTAAGGNASLVMLEE